MVKDSEKDTLLSLKQYFCSIKNNKMEAVQIFLLIFGTMPIGNEPLQFCIRIWYGNTSQIKPSCCE